MLRGGETLEQSERTLQGDGPAPSVTKQQLIDMRALAFDETGGYTFNSSIGQSRLRPTLPTADVNSSNLISFDLAPTGASADYYDFFNSFFSIDWTYVLTLEANLAPPPNDITTDGASWGLFHTLLLFQTVKIYLNGFELDDEAVGFQPFADFVKVCLLEPAQPVSVPPETTPTNVQCFSMPQKVLETGIQSLPFAWENFNYGDFETGLIRHLVAFQNVLNDGDNIWNTTYRPYQSIFLIREFIPCSVRVRVEFTKYLRQTISTGTVPTFYNNEWAMATFRPYRAVVPPSQFIPTMVQMTLYVRVVTLTNQTYTTVSKMAMSMPFTYPVLRAVTTVFDLQSGPAEAINLQVTGQRRPQVVVLHFCKNSRTLASRPQESFPFGSTVADAALAPNVLLRMQSMFLRCGSYRYPVLYSRTRNNLGSGTSGGTIEADYREYANLTYQYKDGDKQLTQPFLNRSNLETPSMANIYFFNMSPQQEPFLERSVIETMNITGTVQIEIQMNAPFNENVRLFVTMLTNEKITVDMLSGRVNRTW